jgi:hypothetical protein
MQVEVTDADRDLLIAIHDCDKHSDEAYRIHNGLAFTWEVEQIARHRIAERERVVRDIVALLREDNGKKYYEGTSIAIDIEAKFGGTSDGQRHED